ncbi:MAG: polyketide synthase dehydratase domain-containing protein, partial [Bacillota bacterium]
MVKSICNLTITADHPLVREHLVHGQALLPGLAYIDLLYQLAPAITGFDYKSCALRRLSLSNPLAVSKNSPIELKITFEKMADIWAITVEGAEAGVSGAGQEEKLYITAELHPATNVFREQINIEGIRQQAVQRIDVERQYEEARKRGLVHRGMLKANGTIYLGVSECLIEVRVAAAYSGMSRNFLFHPTLIDGAALASGILKGHETLGPSDALYLPLYYDSFFCTEPLQNHCLATVNLASVRMVNEIRTLDIVFYNLDGKKIGELRGVTGKRLRFKEQINPDRDRDADVLK